MVVVQATHTFDVNGCDALLHSAQKRKLRSYPASLCTNHIFRDWKKACDEVCHSRTIQRCFMRALRRNTEGDIDESLVPQSIRDWYDGTDAEQDTESENESDCEWSKKIFITKLLKKKEIEYNFDMYSLKTFLPKFCQDLPVIWVK